MAPHNGSSRSSPDGRGELVDDQRRLHERVIAGDELALLESFDRSADLVLCAALLLSGRRSTAEDVTEALFVEFWRRPETFPTAEGPLALQMIRRLVDGLEGEERDGPGPTEPAAAGRAA